MPVSLTYNPLSHFFYKHKEKLLKHKEKLIWFHSTYALAIGIGVMWLGSRNFHFIRLAVWEISFIWLSSLAIPVIFNRMNLTSKWKQRIRLLINYFNRNFYQQLLFFVLPIYYMSTTITSLNVFFIILVAISAILSTMDIVYDRFISVKAFIMSLFFAFNLFACINVMLPILWGVRVVHAVRISAIFAFLGFATFIFKLSEIDKKKKKLIIYASLIMFFILSEFGRSFIPPAPLKLDKMEFGLGMDKKRLQILSPIETLPQGRNRIYAIAHIKAPLKLKEQVRVCWYLNGKQILSTTHHQIEGKGEKGGFRLWTYFTLKKVGEGTVLMVSAETQGDQLIGRSRISF